jgi:transposase
MNHPKMRHIYVGLDLHRLTHTAVIINCFNEKLGSITFDNKPSEFEKLLAEVKKHTARNISALFGLEDVTAYGRALAIFLLKKKQVVKYVNPNLTYSERSNQPILHKTDDYDAQCVSKVLLDKFDKLPDAEINDNYLMLSQLVSRRKALVKACMALKNQIHNFIAQNYPEYKKYFSAFDGRAAIAFWESYPSPKALKNVSVEELASLLRKNSRGTLSIKKASQILESVKNAGNTITEFQNTRDFIITSSVKQLKGNMDDMQVIKNHMAQLVPTFGYKLESMKGINKVMAAELIAEIGDISRFDSPDKLAKYSGISPVVYSSGQTDKIFSNRRGDRSLHELFFMLAVTVTRENYTGKKPVNAIFNAYYKKKISEGKTKKQALKAVMRRLCNIIFWMMKNKTEYRQP